VDCGAPGTIAVFAPNYVFNNAGAFSVKAKVSSSGCSGKCEENAVFKVLAETVQVESPEYSPVSVAIALLGVLIVINWKRVEQYGNQ